MIRPSIFDPNLFDARQISFFGVVLGMNLKGDLTTTCADSFPEMAYFEFVLDYGKFRK
jgi:hypothetical protein